MFPAFADRVARAGFSAVSFNLSGSGVNDAGDFVYPERFGRNTYSAELEDLHRVLAALFEGRLGMLPTSSVGLVGHSRGGGTAILAASRDTRIRALVTWAAISKVHRWATEVADWRSRGHLDVVNSRTGEVLPLYPDVLDDVEQHAAELDIGAAASRLEVPWLLLHGSGDTAVPVAEAEELRVAAPTSHPPRMVLLQDAGHTFGAVHPFLGMTPDLALVFDETLRWLGQHL